MPSVTRRHTPGLLAALLAICAATTLLAPAAAGAKTRSCKSVVNPYPNSRYEGVNLSRIRATAVSCPGARKVAKGAHYKALGLTPTGPIRRFAWRGWRIKGDLRGSSDRYLAKKGKRRVTWRF